MEPELQALREARLAQLRNGVQGTQSKPGNNDGNNNNSNNNSVDSFLIPFLQPEAMERLSRVAMVRPDRAAAVENYLRQLISTGQVQHKVSESEIVQILNGVSKEQQKKSETRIIFERKGDDMLEDDLYDGGKVKDGRSGNDNAVNTDSEDDFFDE